MGKGEEKHEKANVFVIIDSVYDDGSLWVR